MVGGGGGVVKVCLKTNKFFYSERHKPTHITLYTSGLTSRFNFRV